MPLEFRFEFTGFMKHRHDHKPKCLHANMAYCVHCDVPYCKDCGREWGVKRVETTVFPPMKPYRWEERDILPLIERKLCRHAND